jgi:hypothetical protein
MLGFDRDAARTARLTAMILQDVITELDLPRLPSELHHFTSPDVAGKIIEKDDALALISSRWAAKYLVHPTFSFPRLAASRFRRWASSNSLLHFGEQVLSKPLGANCFPHTTHFLRRALSHAGGLMSRGVTTAAARRRRVGLGTVVLMMSPRRGHPV